MSGSALSIIHVPYASRLTQTNGLIQLSMGEMDGPWCDLAAVAAASVRVEEGVIEERLAIHRHEVQYCVRRFALLLLLNSIEFEKEK